MVGQGPHTQARLEAIEAEFEILRKRHRIINVDALPHRQSQASQQVPTKSKETINGYQ
jgi:hypothetical protein